MNKIIKICLTVFTLIALLCSMGCMTLAQENENVEEDVVTVQFTEDAKYAQVTGDFEGLHARVSMAYTLNGATGLFITECVINPNGVIVIPVWGMSGLKINGISVALVETVEEIYKPVNVIAMDYVLFQ